MLAERLVQIEGKETRGRRMKAGVVRWIGRTLRQMQAAELAAGTKTKCKDEYRSSLREREGSAQMLQQMSRRLVPRPRGLGCKGAGPTGGTRICPTDCLFQRDRRMCWDAVPVIAIWSANCTVLSGAWGRWFHPMGSQSRSGEA
jgi:hypothetical protein